MRLFYEKCALGGDPELWDARAKVPSAKERLEDRPGLGSAKHLSSRAPFPRGPAFSRRGFSLGDL
jgi:hypothetical protein